MNILVEIKSVKDIIQIKLRIRKRLVKCSVGEGRMHYPNTILVKNIH